MIFNFIKNMKFNFVTRIFHEIDIFGKEPQFYYKSKEKKKSNIGSIFTLLFGAIYFGLLAYKLTRMIRNQDGVFTDTNINPETPDSILLSNEIFYLGFAIEDPVTYDTILNERIYYPKAFFKRGSRKGEEWIWEVKEVELEICKLEKFGSRYKKIFANKHLDVHYCFKNMDYLLEGHFSYDLYSMLYISLYPCKNTTENNNHCLPLEEIDYYLKGTFVTLEFEDILLTPNDYKSPIKGRTQDIYTTVGKKLFKELHIFFKITNIETDLDFIGINEIENIKTEKYLKYDSYSQMTKLLETNIYETGESFCDITLKLSDLVFYQRRTYTKLLNILGDVGGVMEIFNMIFRFLISFAVDILYETAIINKLFNFELDQTKIKFKKEILNKNININKNEEDKKSSSQMLAKIDGEKDLNNKEKKNAIQNRKSNLKKSKSLRLKNNLFKKRNKGINNNMISSSKAVTLVSENTKNENPDENNASNKCLIKKIKHNKCYLYWCCLCFSCRKNKETIIMDKGMDIIKQHLDIISIFKNMYHDNKQVKIKEDDDLPSINMSIFLKKDENEEEKEEEKEKEKEKEL